MAISVVGTTYSGLLLQLVQRGFIVRQRYDHPAGSATARSALGQHGTNLHSRLLVAIGPERALSPADDLQLSVQLHHLGKWRRGWRLSLGEFFIALDQCVAGPVNRSPSFGPAGCCGTDCVSLCRTSREHRSRHERGGPGGFALDPLHSFWRLVLLASGASWRE